MIVTTTIAGIVVQTSTVRGFAGFTVEQSPNGTWLALGPPFEIGGARRRFCDPQQTAEHAWEFVEEYVNDHDYGCP
jgi:hypothetical protein